jgi:hypothetical protein
MIKVFKPTQPFNPQNITPIEQYKDFYQTWLEFAAQKFEQVLARRTSISGTVYTAPTNKTFYLTNFSMSASTSLAATGFPTMSLFISNDTTRSLGKIDLTVNTTDVSPAGQLTQNFPMPIKIFPGETIEVTFSTGITGAVTIQGFLVPFVR